MKTELNEKWIVCRVCLTNPSEGEEMLQDIFSQNASTRLDQMLHICAGIPVSIDDNFPDKMCAKCVRLLRVAYKFRSTCQRSHQHIADMLATQLSTVIGVEEGEDEDAETEAIARAWEENTNQVNAPIKMEQEAEEASSEFISYVVSGEDAGVVDVYDVATEEQHEVVYDGNDIVTLTEAEIETETDGENFQDYEELEVLASEALNPSTTAVSLADRNVRRIVWSDVPDNDIVNDILSSDDESYLPKAKTKTPPRLLNRVRQPRKVQQKPKTGGSHTDTLLEEKKVGRKPRDKHSNYICDVCGNIYPSQARLTEHMKFHSGIKPHECEICGRGFVQNQQLVRHMNTHTGNRPYKCNFCPAAFADRSTKTKHHRIHTKERPYECDVCLKTFTYSDNLKFHKMIHTGEKPHVCDLCGKGFVKAYKMRLHRVTHEKRGPWKPVDLDIERPERIKNDMSDMVIGILPSS
ncbi:zinc finger and SCAN domain-containing protein 12 [Drosophila nasuta]|uniref:zinc finger and SCAN domain-containing protein 12 n=1 Tax=Drosophila nasuta TaxID=42062 RepID=UPI00295E65EC|nr:zinc finger and SCAN domain-containing protein 12 [Drosophila nasuta]